MKKIYKNVYLRSVKTDNKIRDSPLYISNIALQSAWKYSLFPNIISFKKDIPSP